ncbi:MAG: long-chain fatty acid-CoA ligase [Alyxoria varia]|nr:MAG: long-chain fatty acid-CoA ligase [Alyxoria varia]
MENPKTWRPDARPYKPGPYTAYAPGFEKVDGETVPRRNVRTKDKLKSVPEEGIETVFDIVKRASAKFGNAKAVGSRDVVKTHEENKKIKKVVDGKEQTLDKKWTFFELSGYHYQSFIEYERMVLQVGAGFRKLGMNAQDRVHIFAATSPYWLSTAHASASQSMPIVTAYDTLGEEGLKHSLVQTKARAMFLDPHLLPKLNNPLKEAKSVEFVIYNVQGEAKQQDIDKLKNDHPNLTIMSFEELRKLGEDNPVDPTPPSSEDLCCIMYTSGSTGAPKGVLLKHKNVVAAVTGVDVIVGPYLGPGDGLLTYLPLAHILEFVFENACLFWGGTMGYGGIKTLSDTSVRNCKGDIREFKPSILVGVPAVFESVKKGILGKINSASPVARNMFWFAMRAKSMLLSSGLPGTGVLDSIVFNKIKDATGGNLRICLNGGGPIAKDTQRFISIAVTPMISGYGLTETSAMGAVTDPASWTDSALGEITGSIEIKLVDFPDAGYYSTNNPPQGEIWIRGDPVADGYLDLEKESQEAFEDGWFKTGDIGEFDANGHLRIIDRKKNLVKTLNGEYIALEKLESVYRAASVVGNIMVYAALDKAKPIAVIVPTEPALKQIAKENGIKADKESFESLVKNKKVNAAVLKELLSVGKGGGLQGIELVEGVVLADEEWTPQNGLTTSAQKLNRKGILEKYKGDVDKAYKSGSG